MKWTDPTWHTEYTCSACHRWVSVQQRNILAKLIWRVRFCPFCGASFNTSYPPEEVLETPEP